ncbi:hypothetical protein KCP76_11685 [Salmonella enterica subsp. enterica serovar Weltevreden]|nr:hypothetical protein KCP76_11685 [Salmonella enterica subsp. enterica serovar Weltevreden]
MYCSYAGGEQRFIEEVCCYENLKVSPPANLLAVLAFCWAAICIITVTVLMADCHLLSPAGIPVI